MTRSQILTEIRKYFDIDELVCDHTYTRWKEQAWQFLDTDFLHALLVIRRDIIKRAMWCNCGGKRQRGLRCNSCQMVREKNSVYLSAHCLGKAGYFTVSGMTAEQARQEIKKNAHLLPCNIRLEKGVSWVHMDVLPQYGVSQKVYEFSA